MTNPGRFKGLISIFAAALVAGCGQPSDTETVAEKTAVADVPKYSAEAFFATTSYGLAEVISYDDFIAHKGEQGAKDAGRWSLEGKDYVVQDGDVIHFRFNV